MMAYGSTVEECGFKWVKAHAYDDNATDLLKMERPDGVSIFHSQNRQDKYKITINEAELQTAFLDEYGLSNYVSALMMIPQNSDNYDEYQIMKNLIAEYENQWGFFKYHLSAAPTDEATSKEFLTAVRTLTGKLQFPTSLYNAQIIDGIPVFAKPDELVLLLTPEVEGNIDVQALASIFHVELADINVRRVLVDSLPIPNAVALLTTRDFFMCKDTRYQTATFYDPNTLNTQYYLHHWGIYSVSPLVPAILFTTDESTSVDTIFFRPTEFTLSPPFDSDDEGDWYIKPGGTAQIAANLEGRFVHGIDITYTGDLVTAKPDAMVWKVIGLATSGDDGFQAATFNTRTYVDKHGVLHLQKSAPWMDDDGVPAKVNWSDWESIRVEATCPSYYGTEYPELIASIDVPLQA